MTDIPQWCHDAAAASHIELMGYASTDHGGMQDEAAVAKILWEHAQKNYPWGSINRVGYLRVGLDHATLLIRELEWSAGIGDYGSGDHSCPSCGELKLDGKHADDCKLGNFLK